MTAMALPEELYNIRFAGYFESIKELYQADERFRAICDEYCSAISKGGQYARRMERNLRLKAESDTLSRELEEEILFYIVRSGG